MNCPLFLSSTHKLTLLTSALHGSLDCEDLRESNSPREKTGKLRSHDFKSRVYVLDEIMQTVCVAPAQ